MTDVEPLAPIVALREERRASMPLVDYDTPLTGEELQWAKFGMWRMGVGGHVPYDFHRSLENPRLLVGWCPVCGRWLSVDVDTGVKAGSAFEEMCK